MDDSNKRSAFNFWWVLGKRRRLGTNPSLHASSSSAPNTISSGLPRDSKICPLNESIYELHRPIGTPSMQVLFFHGLQFQDYTSAHLSTWESRDGSQLWPQTLLVNEFPGAHVLSVSYDARVVKGGGKLDLYLIAENLTSDLLRANIGQYPHCPVIFVGHCFGGLVIKRLCLFMHERKSFRRPKLIKFLQNVRGIFYYGTPHHGISSEIAKHFVEGPLLEFVEILSTAAERLNNEFNALRHGCYQNTWRIAGVGENLPTKLGWFRSIVVVREASARDGEIFNVVQGTDHISICKPDGKTSRNFYALTDHLQDIVTHLKVNFHEVQGLPDYPVELEERVGEIEEKLKTTQVLGIVGMGGVGKTTLVKAIFNNISKGFEFTCFVDNVKGIQKHILEDLVLTKFHRNGSRVDGPKTEWPHLRDKKMLLVMDDIDLEEQLSFLPKLDRFGNGSRVIITTRDQSVLDVYEAYVCHDVEFLKEDAAKQLFCKHAFRQEEIPSSFTGRQLITEVIGKCGGLPLTLEVMGRYLHGHEKNPEFWKETIGRLCEAQPITGGRGDRVWATLRVSYDGEKKIFTSAATHFFGQPLEWALAAWSTTYGKPETGWANLVNRCLVKEVYQTQYNSHNDRWMECKAVWVHEHLRDLAGKILPRSNKMDASDEQSAEELVVQLNVKQVAGDSDTEFLDLSYPYQLLDDLSSLKDTRRKKQRTLLYRSLLNMKQLKYITLKGVLLEGFPKKFPSNLSLLSWDGALEEGLEFPVSCIEEMKSLAILKLKNWQTNQAFPVALGKLRNLCILCLKSMKGVDLLPEDLGQLSRLKRVELVGLGVSKLPESFGNLSSLKILTFHDVKLLKLPDSFGNLSTLEELSFYNVQLLEFPESFGKLSALIVLIIEGCENLVLAQNFGLLCSLEELKLGSWRAWGMLEDLPDTFGQLRALKKLTMYQEKLHSLPSNFCDLRSLQELDIIAERLEMLPKNLGMLKSLQKLDLRVSSAKALPKSMGQLSSLRELIFTSDSVEKWSMLPASFCDLGSLQRLEIHAKGLDTLPENMGGLKSLERLTLVVPNMKALPESMGHLSLLRELTFISDFAEKLPESLWELASLQNLALSVARVKLISEKVGQLSSLCELHFESTAVEMIPQSLGQLDSLRVLDLNCPKVEMLPDSLGRLSSLQDLRVDASNMASLPEWLGNLSSLTSLDIEHGKFEYLPNWLGHLSSLEMLGLVNCEKLKSVPDSLGTWASKQETPNPHNSNSSQNSRRLFVDGCPLLDDLVLSSLGWVLEEHGGDIWRRKDYTTIVQPTNALG